VESSHAEDEDSCEQSHGGDGIISVRNLVQGNSSTVSSSSCGGGRGGGCLGSSGSGSSSVNLSVHLSVHLSVGVSVGVSIGVPIGGNRCSVCSTKGSLEESSLFWAGIAQADVQAVGLIFHGKSEGSALVDASSVASKRKSSLIQDSLELSVGGGLRLEDSFHSKFNFFVESVSQDFFSGSLVLGIKELLELRRKSGRVGLLLLFDKSLFLELGLELKVVQLLFKFVISLEFLLVNGNFVFPLFSFSREDRHLPLSLEVKSLGIQLELSLSLSIDHVHNGGGGTSRGSSQESEFKLVLLLREGKFQLLLFSLEGKLGLLELEFLLLESPLSLELGLLDLGFELKFSDSLLLFKSHLLGVLLSFDPHLGMLELELVVGHLSVWVNSSSVDCSTVNCGTVDSGTIDSGSIHGSISTVDLGVKRHWICICLLVL